MIGFVGLPGPFEMLIILGILLILGAPLFVVAAIFFFARKTPSTRISGPSCPSCGGWTVPQANYCPWCGTPLSPP